MTTDNDKAPEWMTDEWLRIVSGGGTEGDPEHFAREILRLRAELADYRDVFHHTMTVTEQAGCPGPQDGPDWVWRMVAERNETRAERAAAIVRADKAEAERDAAREDVRAARENRDIALAAFDAAAAERDAARAEGERLVADARKVGEEMGAIARAADLRCDGCPGCSSFDCGPVPLLAAAKAEIERLNVEIGHTMQVNARLIRERDAAIRDRNAAQEGELNARRALHDAEVDRNELAAGEVGPSVLPMRLDDGRLLVVDSIAGGAHPDAQPDGFPAELTLAWAGDTSCRYVRKTTGACPECDGSGTVEKCDWPGEHANRHQEPCPRGCKAAGAAAPVDSDEAHAQAADAFNEVEVATPAADARQPEPEPEANGAKLSDSLWNAQDHARSGDVRFGLLHLIDAVRAMAGPRYGADTTPADAAERAGGAS